MKLDLKEWINKVTNGIQSWKAPQTVNLTSEWTCPRDGLLNVVIGFNSSSYGYLYIKDNTSNKWVGEIADAGSLGGMLHNTVVPVVKAHKYEIGMQAQVDLCEITYYALGGVVRKLLNALKPLTLGRGWAI